MPKLSKARGYILTKEEYDSIRPEGDKYLLPINQRILTNEEKQKIDEEILKGTSRPQIIKDLNLPSDSVFNNYLEFRFSSKKITEAKTKLLLEKNAIKAN